MMKPKPTLWALFALAIGFRLLLMHWRFAIGFDEPHYLQLGAAARLWGWQHLLHPYWPPMYPALVAILSMFTANFELAGRLVNVLLGAALVFPIFYLAKSLLNDRVALWSALIFALFPATAFSATDALSETTFTFLAFTGVTFGWFALRRRSLWQGAIAGALWGMAYLTKPEGLGYILVFLAFGTLWFVYSALKFKSYSMLKVLLVAPVLTLTVASPYLIYLQAETHDWTISGKYRVNRFDVDSINWLSPDNRQSPLDMAYHQGNFHEYQPVTHAGDDGHARSLGTLARRMAENVYKILRFAIPGVLTAPLLVLLALGLLAFPWRREQTKLNAYLLTFLLFFWIGMIAFFHINDRYFAPLLPACFVWIGAGFVYLAHRLRQIARTLPLKPVATFLAKRHIAVAALLLLGFSFLPEFGKVIGRSPYSPEFWDDAVELKEAGEWIRQNSEKTPVLMSFNKAVDFYAGQYDIRKTATFTLDSLDRIIDYARHQNVDYLVIDARYRERFASLAPLYEGTTRIAGLQREYDRTSAAGVRVLIYRLEAPPAAAVVQ